MAWCSVVAKAPQESQESDENVHFFLQGFASCLPVIKTFFIGANAFDCMFLLLLRALVQARKDEKGCRMSKETRVSFVSSPGGRLEGSWRVTVHTQLCSHCGASPCGQSLPREPPRASHKGKPAGLGVAAGAQYTWRAKIWRNLLFIYHLFLPFSPCLGSHTVLSRSPAAMKELASPLILLSLFIDVFI